MIYILYFIGCLAECIEEDGIIWLSDRDTCIQLVEKHIPGYRELYCIENGKVIASSYWTENK